MGEIEAKLKYKLMPLLSLDLFGGMRFENFSSLADGNTTIKDTITSTNDLAYDYSGFDGGAGISLSF